MDIVYGKKSNRIDEAIALPLSMSSSASKTL